MMLLGYFSEEAYGRLLSNIDENREKYQTDHDWLAAYFDGTEYYSMSNVEVNNFTPYVLPEPKTDAQKSTEDLANTRLMHGAFKKLTPLQATNKHMWTYLCHAIPEYREYIRKRWMINPGLATIRTRYFVTNLDSLLNGNALSRLWWYSHLTYDESNSNPYHLTEILLMNQTICTDVMDTLNRTSFNRIKGVLLGIKDFSCVLDPNEGIVDYFRECKKYLNRYAAVTSLDFLTCDEIRALVSRHMFLQREKRLASGS